MFGWEAEKAVENARSQVAKLIGCDAKEVIVTSGATESNNVALKGLAKFYGDRKRHFVTTQTEHKCVLDSLRHLELEGFEVTYLPVEANGLVDLAKLEGAIRPDTLAVSVMFVNNEIGTVQDIEAIGRICRQKGVLLHTDAAQAFGKLPIDVNKLNIDLMSVSGHKIYGPKGVGCLYVRRRPRVRLVPLFNGGGQERGIRSGTLPTALVVGLGEAARIAAEEMDFDRAHVEALSSYFKKRISEIPNIYFNGDISKGYPGILNYSFQFIEGESLIMSMKNVAISSGSACTSASLEPSYVLRALGVNEELAHTSIRFGIGRFTTKEEIEFTLSLLKERVQILRDLSPLWEFHNEGVSADAIEWTGGSGSKH